MEDKKSVIILLSIIALIVIALVVSYFMVNNAKASSDTKITYNNYVFTKQADSTWLLQLSIKNVPYDIPFYYNPTQINNVTIDDNAISEFVHYERSNPGGIIYMSFDPDQNSKIVIAGVEIARILGQRYNIFNFDVRSSFYRDSNISNVSATGRPIVDCSNATNTTMIVMMIVDNENRVSAANNCIVIKSVDVNSSIMVADALSFKILTITK